MRKTAIIFLLFFSGIFYATAQDYRTGLGFRFGGPTGINAKYFLNSNTAIDGTLGFWEYYGTGISLTGLYEIHKSLNPKNLRFYYGGGLHMGVWNGEFYRINQYYGGSFFGIDGVLGLEYAVKELPLAISIDWNPRMTFYFIGGAWPQFAYVGLTARYTVK
jgi:hypothetical protein